MTHALNGSFLDPHFISLMGFKDAHREIAKNRGRARVMAGPWHMHSFTADALERALSLP